MLNLNLKDMKKLLLLAVVAMMSATGFAQVEKGFRFGVDAGMTVSTITGTASHGYGTTIGYAFGMIADYNFNEKLYLGSGLGFENKGYSVKGYDVAASGTYLTLPIHIGYRLPVGDAWYLHGQVGPTLSVGLWGDTGWWDSFERFELGLGAKVGAEYKKFQLNAGINYALTKSCGSTWGNTWRMFDLSIGLAYMF